MNYKSQMLRPLALAALLACVGAQATTINVINRDAAGVGFNDTTPVAPVGGNPGTTLGQQRLNVYRFVADIWAAAIQSNVTINVNAGWEALTCTATTATLGSAAATHSFANFANAPKAGTWYPMALANKLAGVNLRDGQPDDGTGNADIKTQFNINLGNTGCLDGTTFYLGLDGQAGSQVNFMETLLHEIGHGLGFSVNPTNTSSGARSSNLPSIWESFMLDDTTQKRWLDMTNLERKASAINTNNLVWAGPITVAEAAETLAYPPSLLISTPAQKMPSYFAYGTASFGPVLATPSSLGAVVDTASQACTPLPANSLRGRVAIVDRGTCNFSAKAKTVQDAGAIGAIIVNNAAGSAPGLGGADATVVIPTVSVSQADGVTLRNMVAAAVKYGSRGQAGLINAAAAFNTAGNKAGADAAGRPMLYTPNPLVSGSSVSHWDVSAFPDLLMEPNITPNLTTNLSKPFDLTLPLLKDLGW